MNWSTFKLWLGGAWASFMGGFIEGCPIGAPAGAGMALADGRAFADLGRRHLIIEAAHILAVPFFSGLAELKSYTKTDPFPNVFLIPSPITMTKILPLILLTFLLAGCSSLDSIATKIPPNSFSTVKYEINIGPFQKTTVLTDGVKSADGSVHLGHATASTAFMGYGASLTVDGLIVTPTAK